MVSIKNLLGLQETKSTGFFVAVVAEFLGTCLLVVAGCGSVLTSNAGGQPEILTVAFTFGVAVATSIWLFGHLSGSHINPSVTTAFLVTGHIGILKSVCYILAQLVGGVAGTALLWLTVPHYWMGTFASTVPATGVASWQAVIVELIATFCLVLTVFASCDKLKTDHNGSTALAVGFSLTAQIAWAGNITGASFNPARSLGPAIFSGIWDHHWVYWIAPIAGGILAGLAYEHIFAEKTKSDILRSKYNNSSKQDTKPNSFLDHSVDMESPPKTGTDNMIKNSKGHYKSNETINLDDSLDLNKEQIFRRGNGVVNATKELSNKDEEAVYI